MLFMLVASALEAFAEIQEPILIHRVEPKYTEKARRKKTQGKVKFLIAINEKGVPEVVEPRSKPLGDGLDEAAVRAIEKFRFVPAKKDGKPIVFLAEVETNFALYRDR